MNTPLEKTAEFSEALRRVALGENLFISGVAGTGKSTLLKLLLAQDAENTVVVAPTGVSALNVHGMTIHSFFRFPLHFLQDNDIKYDRRRHELFARLKTVIIDEISMVRADLLDAIDAFLRLNRGSSQAFGGVQMIFFGDMFQLPPIVPANMETVFYERYEGPYFFNAHVASTYPLHYLELTKIFRQKDRHFQLMLNALRENRADHKVFASINECFDPTQNADDDTCVLTLCTTNKRADEINQMQLEKLAQTPFSYQATVEGTFDEKSYPTESLLKLKVGAQVMLLKNDTLEGRWVNGTLASVTALSADGIEIEIRDPDSKKARRYPLERASWETIEYTIDPETKKITPQVVGTFSQFPLRLAWAVTIHKSQGMTFDAVRVDLGRGAFAHGQTYVALSRVRTLSGLHLATRIRPRDVLVDQRVVDYMQEHPA